MNAKEAYKLSTDNLAEIKLLNVILAMIKEACLDGKYQLEIYDTYEYDSDTLKKVCRFLKEDGYNVSTEGSWTLVIDWVSA